MAQKCRICGYRFKPGDGSLCPECFTARDEELRFDIRKDSTDDLFGNKRKEELGSFLADEMRQEFHEDISMKKSLDREDTQKTKSFTAEGAHVKNETFKDAFIERKSRDTSNQGRVYANSSANNKPAQARPDSASPQVNNFLDSIDPTLRSRLYGNQQQNEDKFRYSHHTSNTDITSNQQMLYGINAGKAPSTSSNNTPLTYNFPPTNKTKYSKGSNSKAAIVVIISVVIFIMIINILEEITDNTNNNDNNETKTISSVEINNSGKSDPYYEHELSAKYGEYTLYISNYQHGEKVIDFKDKKHIGYTYPEGDYYKNDKFRELMFEFLIQSEDPNAKVPELDEILLYAYNSEDKLCYCNGYDIIKTPTKTEGEYTMLVTFLLPDSAEKYDLSISYVTSDNNEQHSMINDFTTELIDEWNGKHNDGSSDSSK